jgi:HAD superfamily, subfamily IIIB (Acid phosphatase)
MSDATPGLFGMFQITAVALALCGCLSISPASAQAPDGCYPIPAVVAPNYSQPPNLDFIKKQLLYYRCSQYDADIAAVLDEAQRWVRMRAPQVANPAIVLDIDETSLSNWKRIYRDDFAYIDKGACPLDKEGEPCGDKAWQASEQAPAIGPTRDLYNLARCTDIAPPCQKAEVFFITGRHENHPKVGDKTPREWTLGNLEKAGYNGVSPDHLYMRPADSHGPVAPYKTHARADVERHFNVTIIANVGDQESDLAGGHAERTFKVPNPFYYIP